MKLHSTVEKELACLLELEIEYHQQLIVNKFDLARRPDWTPAFAFETIDSGRNGAIDFKNLMDFCKLNGFKASDAEIVAIVRRMDVDADQRVGV